MQCKSYYEKSVLAAEGQLGLFSRDLHTGLLEIYIGV
jgi:hypothetical protein